MDEQQLIAALKARDPAAVRELVNSCGHRLLRSAFPLCGSETDAQDLVSFRLDPLFQVVRVAPLMNKTEEVNRICFHNVIYVKGKWFGSAAWKTVWANMVASFPLDHLARLPGDPFAEGAR
jgi:hypothetical protein